MRLETYVRAWYNNRMGKTSAAKQAIKRDSADLRVSEESMFGERRMVIMNADEKNHECPPPVAELLIEKGGI